MKIILTIAILAGTMFAMVPAYFTGNSQQVKTVTGKTAMRCEYRLGNGNKFWRTFEGFTCPVSLDVS